MLGVSPSNSSAGDFYAGNSTEVRTTRAKIRAAQFLSKATFGPTEQAIDALANRIIQIGYRSACEEWIDSQFALTPTSHEQTAYDIIAVDGRDINQRNINIGNYRTQAWWHIALTAEDQLRQRVAWALSQIFAVGDSELAFNAYNQYNIPDGGGAGIPLWAGLSNYYDLFVDHADGNYRDLLGGVTFHGNMGVWLSTIGNRKAVKIGNDIVQFPDENFAREIMQLFSVGLYELHQDGRLKVDENGALIPTYTNDDISNLARVFTGFQYSDGINSDNDIRVSGGSVNWGDPMVVYGKFHDNNKDYNEDPNAPANKRFLGATLPALPAEYDSWNDGVNDTSATRTLQNAAAKAEVELALDIISDHPNVGPFIARRLIQRLVKSNPSRAYIRRVAAAWSDNGQGQRGDLRAVVKAILLDSELLRGQRVRRVNSSGNLSVRVTSRGTEYSRLREPVLRISGLIRAVRPTSNWDSGYMMLTNKVFDVTKQGPYKTPTVFNFFTPDFQTHRLVGYIPSRRLPYRELYHPEFQILDATSIIALTDWVNEICRAQGTSLEMTGHVGFCRITFDLSTEIQMATDDSHGGETPINPNDYDDPVANKGRMKEILEHFDLMLCNGSLEESTKRIIYEGLATTAGDGPAQATERVEQMLLAIVISPDCAVEE